MELLNQFEKKYNVTGSVFNTLCNKLASIQITTEIKKHEKYFIDEIYEIFYEFIYTNESLKTYQYEILPPYLIKDKSNFCVCPYFNNSKQLLVALCCPFACFYNNEFLWLDDNIHKKINQKYSFNFFNCELIKNINKDLADKLALVVRVLFYKEKLELYNGDKKMFTNTYISFIFNKIKIYCLIDLNIDEKSNRFNNLLKKINFPNKEN